MPVKVKYSWRVHVPAFAVIFGVFVFTSLLGSESLWKYSAKKPEILPVYSEDGKLSGFTHPRMVEISNLKREKLAAQASASKQ